MLNKSINGIVFYGLKLDITNFTIFWNKTCIRLVTICDSPQQLGDSISTIISLQCSDIVTFNSALTNANKRKKNRNESTGRNEEPELVCELLFIFNFSRHKFHKLCLQLQVFIIIWYLKSMNIDEACSALNKMWHGIIDSRQIHEELDVKMTMMSEDYMKPAGYCFFEMFTNGNWKPMLWMLLLQSFNFFVFIVNSKLLSTTPQYIF